MKLTTFLLTGLLLAIGAADGLAFSAIDTLEGALRQRMEAMDAAGDLDKADRKRRKALFKCLKRMGKTRQDLKDDVELLDRIAKKLSRRFEEDPQVFAVVSAAAAAAWFNAVTTLDGLSWKVEEGENLIGGRQRKAQKSMDDASPLLTQAWHEMLPPIRGKAMSTEEVALDWTKLRAALKSMRKAVRRFPKILRWLGPEECPGDPIESGESAAIEYARDHGALVTAFRSDVTHVEGIVYEDAPVEAVILLTVCQAGRPTMTVEMVVSGPLYPAAWEQAYTADGSPGAEARITIFGPHGYPGGGRPATGTVTITDFDQASERMTGTFRILGIGSSGLDGVDIRGFFDIDVECRGRAE